MTYDDREYQKECREKHKKSRAEYNRQYRLKHHERLLEYARQYRLKRRQRDPEFQETKRQEVNGVRRERFQHDDFITDSIYSADSHIGYERLRLINYSVQIERELAGFYLLATCIFEKVDKRAELNIVEKFVDEAQKIFKGLDISRKVFQFDDLRFYINLYFTLPENVGSMAPIKMQKMLRQQLQANIVRAH